MNDLLSIMDRGNQLISFDDVLLVPNFSEIGSRLSVSTSTKVGPLELDIPIIASPMDTVTEGAMAVEMGMLGGAGIVHRFLDEKTQLWNLLPAAKAKRDNISGKPPVIPAIGVGNAELKRLEYLMSGLQDIDAVAIDIANGHSSLMSSMVNDVNSLTGGTIPIIVGNVATGDGFMYLADLGVAAVRVGIGGGSICKTRIMTGYGLPTLSSVALCSSARANHGYDSVGIIADGGIRYPSDLVKSIAAGADSVMCGRVLAGTDESPGGIVVVNDNRVKLYRGMASSEAQVARGTGRKSGTCSEGVSAHIPYVGSTASVIEDFIGGF
jgi:IMP dehydrogenase